MNARTSTTTRSEPAPASAATDERPAAARAALYRYLSLAFGDPCAGTVDALARQWPLTEAALRALGLTTDQAAAAAGVDGDALRRAHLSVFGHAMSKDCPPYGGEYGQAHIFEKTQTLADVAGFYRAFGLALAEDAHERPDHIALEMEFMEFLCLKQAWAETEGHGSERIALCAGAQRRFLKDHLGFWAFSFAHRLLQRPDPGPFAAWAGLLETFLAQELAAAGIPRHADPFVNEGAAERPDDGACGACPASAFANPVEGRNEA